ncbi:MAG: glycosyltransferase family 4 protein [Polyangiales bacterium]
MKRFLWITPKWPIPATDGARQATTQLVSALCEMGTPIDLVALVPEREAVRESEAVDALGIRTATVVRRPNATRGLHVRNALRTPFRAITLAQYSMASARDVLEDAASTPDTVIVFDGLHSGASLQQCEVMPSAPMVYRAHNVEADLWFRAATQAKGIAPPLLRWQGRLVQRFERNLCRASRLVLPVSDTDADRFRELAPTANVHTLPIGMSPKVQRPTPAEGDQLLFIGRLDWPPNRDGLRWFLDNVWPHVVRPWRLTLVGSGDGRWLSSYLDDPRIRFLGEVDSVTPHYHKALLSLVPIFYGSGTRVKAIESSLYATACLATECGVDGIGLDPTQDYFRAESAEQWIGALNDLDVKAARERGHNARDRVTARYGGRRIAEDFLRAVDASLEGELG